MNGALRYANTPYSYDMAKVVPDQFVNWHTLMVNTLGKSARLSVDLTAIDNLFLMKFL